VREVEEVVERQGKEIVAEEGQERSEEKEGRRVMCP